MPIRIETKILHFSSTFQRKFPRTIGLPSPVVCRANLEVINEETGVRFVISAPVLHDRHTGFMVRAENRRTTWMICRGIIDAHAV